jgi:tRNA (guanosine-2'-O-)-methyltransferase
MKETKFATPREMRDMVAGTRTDDPSWFEYDAGTVSPDALTALLTEHLSDARRQAIESVLDGRTENVAVVVEGVVDVGNVSAIMRTADGFGIQRVHAVDSAGTYKRSKRTTRGADKWVDRYRWETTEGCFEQLRGDGYRIVAADVGETAVPISDLGLTDRCAIVFGNELEGLTDAAREGADALVTVPMEGFAESFNISVAAAVSLYEIHRQRVARYGTSGDLSPDARSRIRAVWYAKTVTNARRVIEHKLSDAQPS